MWLSITAVMDVRSELVWTLRIPLICARRCEGIDVILLLLLHFPQQRMQPMVHHMEISTKIYA